MSICVVTSSSSLLQKIPLEHRELISMVETSCTVLVLSSKFIVYKSTGLFA